jgi:large subunit ribosomal protein L4
VQEITRQKGFPMCLVQVKSLTDKKEQGRARFGTLRAPQYVGGATVFGPVVRSHATELPKKQRVLALKTALSSKVASGKLVILDAATAKAPKTKRYDCRSEIFGN